LIVIEADTYSLDTIAGALSAAGMYLGRSRAGALRVMHIPAHLQRSAGNHQQESGENEG
jgi:hypothetical protein